MPRPPRRETNDPARDPSVRIIGGRFRGRKIHYSGDPRTRPMKDRLREAIFNILGPAVKGKHALDLFAGTGALGLEALSRGAVSATFVEQHFPTAGLIRQSLRSLEAEGLAEVAAGNTFLWWQDAPKMPDRPWVVFCSPPYAFYVDRRVEIMTLICGTLEAAPAGSIIVVESDDRFDFAWLPDAGEWDVRAYSPAIVGVYRKPTD